MRKVVTLFSVISLLVLCLSGISLASPGEKPEEFKLGILLPFTGTFAAVAKTQMEGALQAVNEINAKGGLSMPWGKVKVVTTVMDDETKIDVGVRRFKYLLAEGVNAVEGQTWNPLSFAINELAKKSAIPYFPTCVAAYDSFKKGAMAECTFAVAFQAWTIGAMAGDAVVNTLGKKRIYYLSRSDSWGEGIEAGLRSIIDANPDANLIGMDSVPKGTATFTSILQKVKEAKPDVFVFAQFGGDCAAVLKQSAELELQKKGIDLFNTWMTNAVAKGIPQEMLEGVYANAYFYWDLTGFPDKEVAEAVKAFSERYEKVWGAPPDAYGVIAYDATQALLQGVEKAGSFDPGDIAKAIFKDPKFTCAKGSAYWRIDHEPVFEYAGFMLKGKAPEDREGGWDFFDVMGSMGGEIVLPPLEDLGF